MCARACVCVCGVRVCVCARASPIPSQYLQFELFFCIFHTVSESTSWYFWLSALDDSRLPCRAKVSIRISRERRDGQGGLGSGYYVGVVDPTFESWDARIHSPPLGFGMEDDNSSSSRRWHFRGNRLVGSVLCPGPSPRHLPYCQETHKHTSGNKHSGNSAISRHAHKSGAT